MTQNLLIVLPMNRWYGKHDNVVLDSALGEFITNRLILSKRYELVRLCSAWFVLTGKIPQISPLRLEYRQRWDQKFGSKMRVRFSFDIHPLTPPSELEKAYRNARKKLLGNRRALKEKTLSLVEFVSTRKLYDAARRYGDRMIEWNKTYPKWYYSKETNFHKDYHRAMKRLMGITISQALNVVQESEGLHYR